MERPLAGRFVEPARGAGVSSFEMAARSILVRLGLVVMLPFAVVRGVAIFATPETVAAMLDDLCRSSSQARVGILRQTCVPDRLSNFALFQRAYQLGESREALLIWQRLMAEKPDATDLDYVYGHAVACAAALGDGDLTLAYYEVMRRDHDGWRHTGCGGASRRWEERLARARRLISAHPRRVAVLSRMDELDRAARARRVESVTRLIRRANAGDPLAKQLLLANASNLEMMVEMAAEGRLVLVPPLREPPVR